MPEVDNGANYDAQGSMDDAVAKHNKENPGAWNGKTAWKGDGAWGDKWAHDQATGQGSAETADFLKNQLGYTEDELAAGPNCEGDHMEWNPDKEGTLMGGCDCESGYVSTGEDEDGNIEGCEEACTEEDQEWDEDLEDCKCIDPAQEIKTETGINHGQCVDRCTEANTEWDESSEECVCVDGWEQDPDISGAVVCIESCADGTEYFPDEREWDSDAQECKCPDESHDFVTDSAQFDGQGKCLQAHEGTIVWVNVGDGWSAYRDTSGTAANGYWASVGSTAYYDCDGEEWRKTQGSPNHIMVQDTSPDGDGEKHDEYSMPGNNDFFIGDFPSSTFGSGAGQVQTPSMDAGYLKGGQGTTNAASYKIQGVDDSSLTTAAPGTDGYLDFGCDICDRTEDCDNDNDGFRGDDDPDDTNPNSPQPQGGLTV